jgi:flavin-dependent dehydrogenase
MRVLVVEPRAGVIDKACGEGIMPAGVTALRMLGVHVRGRTFAGVRYICDELSAEGSFRDASGLGVRRFALHEALRERAVSLGVDWQRGSVTALEDVRSRWIVGADGLRSRVRALIGAELPPHRAPRFGMRRHFRIEPWTDRVEVHFTPGVEAYVTPVADDTVGVAFLFTRKGRWDELLARFPVLERRVANVAPASELRGGGPFEQRVARRVRGNVLLAGDAAGYLDPLTGEGVALGVQTAIEAVNSIAEGEPERYEERWRALTRRHFVLTRALLAIVERPALHRPFVAAARALPGAFDAVLTDTGGSARASRGKPRDPWSTWPRSRSPAFPP